MIRGAAVAAAILMLGGCDDAIHDQLFDPPKKRSAEERPFEGGLIKHDDRRAVTCWVWSHPSRNEGGMSCLPDWMLQRPAIKAEKCLLKDLGKSDACRELFAEPEPKAKLPMCRPQYRGACVDEHGQEWPADFPEVRP